MGEDFEVEVKRVWAEIRNHTHDVNFAALQQPQQPVAQQEAPQRSQSPMPINRRAPSPQPGSRMVSMQQLQQAGSQAGVPMQGTPQMARMQQMQAQKLQIMQQQQQGTGFATIDASSNGRANTYDQQFEVLPDGYPSRGSSIAAQPG